MHSELAGSMNTWTSSLPCPPSEPLKLGKGYIWGTSLRRQTSKPYFVDKMPNTTRRNMLIH